MTNSTQLSLVLVDPRIPDSHIIDRFWSKVDRSGECWLWLAATGRGGYGAWAYNRDGKIVNWKAHRFAFLVTYGFLTEGKQLHHRCENPACVRPTHLIELSHGEHMAITPGTYGHIHAGKTHCKHGHELSGDNLYAGALRRGVRQCKACVTRRNAEARANHPEKLREAVRSYKERNAEKVRAKDREYHARKRAEALLANGT